MRKIIVAAFAAFAGVACAVDSDRETQPLAFIEKVTTGGGEDSPRLEMKKIPDMKKGTVAFWATPLDWKGGDNKFHHFFEASGADARLIVYKHAQGKDLTFLLGPEHKPGKTPEWSVTKTSIAGWEENSRHHITCAWDEKNLRLYVDGELRSSAPLTKEPASTFSTFCIGAIPSKWGKAEGRSLVEDFKFYDAVLAPQAIHKEYMKKADDKTAPGLEVVTLPRLASRPVIDGVANPGEYAFEGTGFLDADTGVLSSLQSRFSLAHDNENIYFGMTSPAHAKMLSNVSLRDGPVWQDDSAEIFLAPPGTKDYFHFIFNSRGALFDEMNGGRKDEYNADLEIANNIKDGMWTLEARIPISFLGGKSPSSGEVWKFTVCRTFPALEKCTSTTSRGKPMMYDSPEHFSALRFSGENGPSLAVGSFGDLEGGVLRVHPEIRGPAPAAPLSFKCQLRSQKGLVLDEEKELKCGDGGRQSIAFEATGIWEKAAAVEFVPTSDEAPTSKRNAPAKPMLAISMKSGDEVRYMQKIPISTTTSVKLSSLYTSHDKKSLALSFEQSHVTVGGKTFKGAISIIDQAGKKVAGQEFVPENLLYEKNTDIGSLPKGQYVLETVFTDQDGKTIHNERRNYWIMDKTPEWQGNQAGISDKVPPPWEPLRKEGDIIKCWGRSYSFEKGFMPPEIISQGVGLLNSAPLMKGVVGGVEATEKRDSLEWVKTTPGKVSLTARSSLGKARIVSEMEIEYDGFCWFATSITPEPGVKIEKLFLEIPVNKSAATLVNSCDYRLNGTGILPDYWSKNLKNKPLFWVGNEKAGIQWFANNLNGWKLANPRKGVEIATKGDARVIRLNIADTPFQQEIRLSFGIQATPVKKRMAGAEKLRIMDDDKTRDPRENLSLWSHAFQCYAYPDTKKMPRGYLEKLEALRAKNAKVCPYLSLGTTSPITPEHMYYGEEWRHIPSPRPHIPTIRECKKLDEVYTELLTYVCAGSSQYRDFLLWRISEVWDKLKLDGLYFDFAQIHPCSNSLHGCECDSFNLLATRELAKRIYVFAKEKNPDAIIAHHTSGEIAAPVISFCDLLVDGENFNGTELAKEKNYFKLLPLDKFRAEYTSQPWGPATVFLPEFGCSNFFFDKSPNKNDFGKTDEAQKAARHLLGLVVTHGSLCWPQWASGFNWMFTANPIYKVWDVQDEFGWGDGMTFHPYWDNSRFIEFQNPTPPEMVVSFYKKDNKLLLMPLNNTDSSLKTQLRINFEVLGFAPGGNVVIANKKEDHDLKLERNVLSLDMKARDFKMIILERK